MEFCSCENGKYLVSINDNSGIMSDEVIDADAEAKLCDEETKTIPKNLICETKSFILYLPFY